MFIWFQMLMITFFFLGFWQTWQVIVFITYLAVAICYRHGLVEKKLVCLSHEITCSIFFNTVILCSLQKSGIRFYNYVYFFLCKVFLIFHILIFHQFWVNDYLIEYVYINQFFWNFYYKYLKILHFFFIFNKIKQIISITFSTFSGSLCLKCNNIFKQNM